MRHPAAILRCRPACSDEWEVRSDSDSATKASLIGTTAIAAFSVAAVVLAFAPDAPLVPVFLTSTFLGGSIAIVAMIGFTRPLHHLLAVERTGRSTIDAELAQARARRGFIEQLDTAIDMADTEDEAIDIVGRALTMLLPDRDNFVLLASPNEPRVAWSIQAGPDGLDDPSNIGGAVRCSGLSLGRTVTAASSHELDACPHLVQHGWEVSSMCIPIRVGDRHLGVAHSAGPAGDLPDEEGRRLLELVARRVGSRIATLRANRTSNDHVSLDPLTHLANHTVAKRRLREIMTDGTTFAVAFSDIDRFATYNQSHGSEHGDRALRIYAEVLGATLRPGDLIARYSGDRFLCVFPNCTATHAASAMERVRESLVLELAIHETDPFTTSVGVVDSSDATTVDDLLEHADVALAVAKNGGGNRVVVDDFDEIHLGPGAP